MAATKEDPVPTEEVYELDIWEVVMIPETLMNLKEVVSNSNLVLKSQICSILDQAIQLSLVK